ncbi:phage tail protein [Thauera sinica]|uniref:Phage tail protein n=1 Tax=Thauera sinica TaxID=2665146 RepID=A0ABW1AKU3_9RHOO|nr:phage tail protein [Thauera sp. K11]ATE59872.1 phage tail protein [Thauera sp. K11]
MADPLSREQQERLDFAPLHVFRFHVSFRKQALGHRPAGDTEVPICQGAFSECTGLEATMEPKVIKAGGSNYGAAQRAGPVTFATVVLKRGMTKTRDLWNWFGMVGGGAYAYRLMVEIEMRNARDEAVVRWALRRAMPVKFKAADLNAKGSEVGIEELHLAHEGLVLLPVSGG